MTAPYGPLSATVPLSTSTELPTTLSSGITSFNQLPTKAHAFKVSLRHGRHHANLMTSVESLPVYGRPVDDESIVHELRQPSHAADRSFPTHVVGNFTSADSWCSSAAVSDGRVVAASADDATGQRVVGAGPSAVVGSAGGHTVAAQGHGGCHGQRASECIHSLQVDWGRGVGL